MSQKKVLEPEKGHNLEGRLSYLQPILEHVLDYEAHWYTKYFVSDISGNVAAYIYALI